MRLLLLSVFCLAIVSVSAAQDSRPASSPAVEPVASSEQALTASVPVFPNSTCPVMGKPISKALWTDTEFGRIWICCKGCDKKIKKDPATAYKTAYPVTKVIKNAVCPIMGDTVDEKSPRVALQGLDFAVCCDECVDIAKAELQTTLAKVNDARVRDLENTSCPLTGKPVEKNAFVVIGSHLVRLSSPACVDDAKKDPAATLEKAKAATTKPAVKDSEKS